MNKWLRKSLFVIVSIFTFGLITPTQLMNAVNADSPNERDAFEAPLQTNSVLEAEGYFEDSKFDRESFVEELLKKAEVRSYQKFGNKIRPVIENEFRDIILPKIQSAIEETAAQFPTEDLKNLTISENPGRGYSEKIFNIKSSTTGEDILRFHVRKDHPPKQGFWFNFHYHTCYDDFQTHHELGAIYWAKDTPPKWMS